MCRLKEKGRSFRESFLAKLCLLLRGTVAAPPERFGETLADEHIRGGAHMRAHGPAAHLHALVFLIRLDNGHVVSNGSTAGRGTEHYRMLQRA